MLALRSLGSSGAVTKMLAALDAAVLADLPREHTADEAPPGSPLLHSELLPELSHMLMAAGAGQRLCSVCILHGLRT